MSGPWEDFAPKPYVTNFSGSPQKVADLERRAASIHQQEHPATSADSGAPWEDFTQPAPTPEPPRSSFRRNILGGAVEPVLAVASGAIAKPASDIAGLSLLVMDGLRRMGVPGISEKDPLAFKQDVQRSLTYDPRTAAGQAVMAPLGAIGKAVDWAAEGVRNLVAPPDTSGPVREAVGRGVEEAVKQAPMFIGMKVPGAAAATEAGLKSGAREMMQSALKPPLKALQTGKAARAIDTLLDEGINVTGGGADTLRGRIDVLNNNIAQRIANSPAIIDKYAASSQMQGLLNKFTKQVSPLSDVAAIQKAWDEFLAHPMMQGPYGVPVQTAQELKQGTYRALGDKSYGELKGAEIEAQKTLARGLKEEIAKAVPEVRPLNAEESTLLNALSLVERRVLISANKNPIGLGFLTLNPKNFAAYMADRSELFKSLVARMLNTGSKAVPGMEIAGPAGGIAATEQANQGGQ